MLSSHTMAATGVPPTTASAEETAQPATDAMSEAFAALDRFAKDMFAKAEAPAASPPPQQLPEDFVTSLEQDAPVDVGDNAINRQDSSSHGVLGRAVRTKDDLHTNLVGSMTKTVGAVGGGVHSAVAGGVSGVTNTMSSIARGKPNEVIDGVAGAVTGVSGGVTKGVSGGVQSAASGVRDGVHSAAKVIDGVGHAVGGVADGVQFAVSGVREGVQENVQRASRDMKKINGVSSAVVTMSNTTTRTVSGVKDNMEAAVGSVMKIDGVSSAVSVAGDGMQSAVSNVSAVSKNVMETPLVSGASAVVNSGVHTAASAAAFGVGFAVTAPPILLKNVMERSGEGIGHVLHQGQQAPGKIKSVLQRVLSSDRLIQQSEGDGAGAGSSGEVGSRSARRSGDRPASLADGPPITLAEGLRVMQDVLIGEDDVRIAPLMLAIKRCYLLSLEALGGWTYIAAREIKANLLKIEFSASFRALSAASPTESSADADRSVTLLQLLEWEQAANLHAAVGPNVALMDESAAMGLTWLLRFLMLWVEMWTDERRAHPFAESLDLSYKQSCGPYHGWVVQKAMAVACTIVPTWEEVRTLLANVDVDGQDGVLRCVDALRPVLARIEAALRGRGLWDSHVI